MLKQRTPQVGEIVRAQDEFGFLPNAIYKVEAVNEDRIELSAGDFYYGTHPSIFKLIAGNLAEPSSWLETQVDILKQQVKRCECAECFELLGVKQKALEKERKKQELPN